MAQVKLIAIDPWDCGCTECITGEYAPLRYATDEQIADLIAGRLRNNLNSGTELTIIITHVTRGGKLVPDEISVQYEHHDGQTRKWAPDLYRCGLAA